MMHSCFVSRVFPDDELPSTFTSSSLTFHIWRRFKEMPQAKGFGPFSVFSRLQRYKSLSRKSPAARIHSSSNHTMASSAKAPSRLILGKSEPSFIYGTAWKKNQ